MADQLRDLVLRLTADSRQLVSELRKVESGNSRTTKRIESEWKKTASSISGAFSKGLNFAGLGGLAGGLAGGGAVLGLTALASDAQDSASAIDDLSNRLGISRTAIQEYQFAARAAGIEQGAFEGALQKFGKAVGEAALGTGKARTSLSALGVSVRDASGEARTIEAVFEDVVRALAEVENASTRTALAQRIFGQSGAAVAALSLEFAKQIGLARDLGIAIDSDVIKSLADSQDLSEQLSAVLDQRLSKSLSTVANALVGVKQRVVEFAEAVVRAVERTQFLQRALENLTPVSLIDDLAAVDRQSAETSARIQDLLDQMQRFRELNAGSPARVVDDQLQPLAKKLASEIDLLKRLFEQRARLAGVDDTETGSTIDLDASALDPSKGKEAARRAAAEAKAAAREVEAAQQRLNSVIEASFSPAEKLLSNLEEISADYRAGKISAEQFAEGQDAIVRQFDTLDEKIQSSALKEIDSIIEAGLTPAEKLVEQLDRIGQLYQDGSIDAEKFALAQESVEKQLKDIEADELKDSLKDLEQVGTGVFEGLTGALSDFVLTGKGDLASLAQSFASEFVQLGFKSIIGGALGSVPGLEGIFGGARAAGGPVSTGKAFLVGERGPELFVPKSAGFVVPNMGARGSAGAAVAVAPPAPVIVNISNSSRSDVQAQERVGPSGQREIEILITDVIARDIARGGPVGRSVDGRLGVRPRGV